MYLHSLENFEEGVGHPASNDHGVYLVAAHLLTMPADDLAGEITSSTMGDQTDTSRPVTSSPGDGFYTSTVYGRRFLALLHSSSDIGIAVF